MTSKFDDRNEGGVNIHGLQWETTYNEKVLTLQTRNFLESALDAGCDLALVLVAALQSILFSLGPRF